MALLDLDLVLSLSNNAALRALFAQLGYQPQSGVFYAAQTLEWPDNVAAALGDRRFEVLAQADGDAFQVMVLPPAGHTSGLTRALQARLFRSFEQRLREGILIMPNAAWDTFELVLLADYRSIEEKQTELPLELLRWSFSPHALRPHQERALEMLAIHAVEPNAIAEHVHKAFVRAQQESLFRAQGFFSQYYLEQRIDSDEVVRTDWSAIVAAMPALRAALHGAAAIPEMLACLGWEVVDSGETQRLVKDDVPVAVFATIDDSLAPLESQHDSTHPHFALIAALRQEKEQNGLKWGILTNGRRWRLYSTLTSSISGAYFEIDLADILAFGDDRDVAYFGGLFGPLGLVSAPDAASFVQRAYASAQTLSKKLGDNLKKTVFEQVFPRLASGIADDLRRSGTWDGSEEQLRVVFRATLIVLYRVLFLLYAESRRLLPTLNPAYYPHSLTRLLTEIAIRPFIPEHNRKPLDPTAFWAWEWLRNLWAAVDNGQADWGVPRYNGGLFGNGGSASEASDHKAPYRLLSQINLGAMDLCPALSYLSREAASIDAKTLESARQFIDYGALDVRRLGSIYEGLLEFQLVEVSEGSFPRLELRNTRQERKASGSYYTPDYIVQYIVSQAVGPVLQERTAQFNEVMPSLAARRKELERYRRNGYAGADVLAEDVEKLELKASEALLDLKVLDPAMGSGHFLVEAVDFLTDGMIEVLQKYPDNPIMQRIQTIRTDIRASMAEQGLNESFLDEEHLSDARLLRRLVMKRCVYGVDLNDMAVELAKLSLWLHSFTVGAPLSFLDHHLKWGNSLIGARVRDVQDAMEGQKQASGALQFDMFGSNSAFREMLNLAAQIEELVQIADANGQQVEQSAALYATYEEHVIPVKRLLDLWVSKYFGSREAEQLIRLYSGNQENVQAIVDALMGRSKHAIDHKAIETARALFRQYRFFHWDLEFPEVFIDLSKKAWKEPDAAGFDAVVGNPPYVRTKEFTYIQTYLNSQYNFAYGAYDIYILFMEQSIKLIHKNGILGYITSNKFLIADYATKLRKYISNSLYISEIIDLSNSPSVFENALISSAITILNKQEPTNKLTSFIGFFKKDEADKINMIKNIINNGRYNEISSYFQFSLKTNNGFVNENSGHFDIQVAEDTEKILYLLYKNSTKLEDIAYVRTGVMGFNYWSLEPIITDTDIVNDNNIPILPPSLVQPYIINWGDESVNLYKKIYKYPVVKYDPNIIDNNTWNLFKEQKIIVKGVGMRLSAALDENGFAILVAVHSVQSYNLNNKSILSIINSNLLNWLHVMKYYSARIPEGSLRYPVSFLEQLPIRKITFTTSEAERAALVRDGIAQYEQRLASIEKAPHWHGWRDHWRNVWEWVDSLLPQHSDGSPDTEREHSDVIHDLLAHLAEQMIDLNKAKQAEARRFTDWLEHETSSDIDGWKLKTAVQRYWEQKWEAMERAIQQNRAKLVQTANLRGKHADEALKPLLQATQQRWERSKSALAPTLAAIVATDRLIDLIVYRLYGLTDDEIDVVEGI